MVKRFLAVIISLVVAGLVLGAPQADTKAKLSPKQKAAKGKQTAPIKIGAIFAVTGPAANLGAPEAKTAEMFVDKLNETGGVNGQKVQLIVKDSAGDPEKAVSLAKQLIDEEKVLAIIGPSTSGETMQIKNICEEGQTILVSCAAAETIVNPVASYVFKTPQKDSQAATWIYNTMKDKGITKIGVLVSNDGFGTAGKKQLETLAPAAGITIALAEVYDKQATDLTDVLTKVKGKEVQAVVNWSIVPAQSMVAKNMKQIGLDVPLFQSHGFGNIKYVEQAGRPPTARSSRAAACWSPMSCPTTIRRRQCSRSTRRTTRAGTRKTSAPSAAMPMTPCWS